MGEIGVALCLQPLEEGNQGWLIWGNDRLTAIINWNDPVVHHGLRHRIKYARLIRRKATSPRAEGADSLDYRYNVQLALEGIPYARARLPESLSTPQQELVYRRGRLEALG